MRQEQRKIPTEERGDRNRERHQHTRTLLTKVRDFLKSSTIVDTKNPKLKSHRRREQRDESAGM